ncbi:hypothetical protein D3C71_1772480 [compost metagenome]
MYYASDYESYKDMFDAVNKRISIVQRAADSLAKIDEKKAAKAAKKKAAAVKDSVSKPAPKVNDDSIRKVRMEQRRKRL